VSLKKDIENAFLDSLGKKPEDDKGNIPKLAENLTEAIVSFLQKQTFTITELESILRVEEIKTTGTLPADVLDKVEVKTEGITGTPSGGGGIVPGTGEGIGSVQRRSGKEGVKIPKLDLKLSGGQGGSMTAIGHSYIGTNPVDSRERNNQHGDNKVKLLKVVGDK
tara:strand:- start:757 stop:1251 length:495 start_codon:yes stop_codon:yes gene_type:complete